MKTWQVRVASWHHDHSVTTLNEVRNTESLPKNQSLAHRLMIEERRPHGKENTYKMGCRCDECLAAHREMARAHDKRRRERKKNVHQG